MLSSVSIVVLSVVALAALLVRRGALLGTTLMAPWGWAVAVVVVAAVAEGTIAAMEPSARAAWAVSLRYAAAVATLLPVMSILGAKRPQDRAWQWIVASLWAVLLVPVIQAALFSRGGSLDVHIAWRGFLAVLIVVGLINFCFTRFVLPAVLLAASQVALLWPHLPGVPSSEGWPLAGWLLSTAAIGAWAMCFPHRSHQPPGRQRLWLIFRDHYGLLWSLRVIERFNAAAVMYDWPVRLAWEGFTSSQHHGPPPCLPPDVQQKLDTTFRSLLRRFLAPETIAQQLAAAASADQRPSTSDAASSEKAASTAGTSPAESPLPCDAAAPSADEANPQDQNPATGSGPTIMPG